MRAIKIARSITGKCREPAYKDGNTGTEGCETTKAVEKVNQERAFLTFLNTRTKGHEMKLAKAKFVTVI